MRKPVTFGVVAVAVVVAAIGVVLFTRSSGQGVTAPLTAAPSAPASPPSAAPASPTTSPTAGSAGEDTLGTSAATLGSIADRAGQVPVRVRIPSLGVDAPILAAGVSADGQLEVPENVVQTAWYRRSALPGASGTAVIAAHVDLDGSFGIFHELPRLRPGARIEVVAKDGKISSFTVAKGYLAPKADPSSIAALVAARDDRSAIGLALVTCGGAFNRATGSYVDNYIVLANQ